MSAHGTSSVRLDPDPPSAAARLTADRFIASRSGEACQPRRVLAPGRRRLGDQSAGHGDWRVREMSRFSGRPRLVVACLLWGAALYGGVSIPAAGAKAGKPPVYGLVNVGAFGGEPSIWANGKGELYDTTPSGGPVLYKSTDHGASW